MVADIVLRFGNKDTLPKVRTAAQFLGSMLMRGTKNKTRQEIRDELDKLGASLGASSGSGSLSFSLQAKRETLPKVLDLLREIAREPGFRKKNSIFCSK